MKEGRMEERVREKRERMDTEEGRGIRGTGERKKIAMCYELPKM